MPILCIDLVILWDRKVLLLRRLREPVKDQLWFPGGALFRNEEFEDAVRRLGREEVGMGFADMRFLGVDNMIFPTDPFGHGKGTHTPTILFRCLPEGDPVVTIDEDHSGYVWSDGHAGELDPHLKRFILLAQHAK